MKKIQFVLFPTLLLLTIVGFFLNKEQNLNDKYIHSTIPTLFFHGYGSSSNAQKHMTKAALELGVTQTVIRATVSKEERVLLDGKMTQNAMNPIIQVQFEDNRNSDYHTDARYARAVVKELQKQYGIKEINMVGHSMGNMAISFYMLDFGNDSSLPKLQKQVAIAGHFNGIENLDMPADFQLHSETGKPSKMSNSYKELLKLKEVYPKNQVQVLNIYGNLKNRSDGSVLNDSSKSLKYLLATNAKTYQEKEIIGKLAQHSQLHENPQVDALLIDFLWGK